MPQWKGDSQNKVSQNTGHTKIALGSLEIDDIIAASSGGNVFVLDLALAILPSPELPLPLRGAKQVELSTRGDDRKLLNHQVSF